MLTDKDAAAWLVYATAEDELAHYGVKGMRWGVRKEEELSERDLAVRKAAGANSKTSDKYKAMYGPKQSSDGLTDKQKKILLGVGIGVGVAALAVGSVFAYKYISVNGVRQLIPFDKKEFLYNVKDYIDDTPVQPATPFQNFLAKGAQQKFENTIGFSKDDFANLSTEPVNLDVGSILKRVSTEKESVINPSGFFAAHKEADINRYKAVLPTYWQQWGFEKKEGFVVSLKNKKPIKAPSPKKTIDIFKSIFDDVIEQDEFIGDDLESLTIKKIKVPVRQVVEDFADSLVNYTAKNDDELAQIVFPNFSMAWVTDGEKNNPLVAAFFDKVKAEGFNALVDMNDAGSIGDQPLRILDGSIFEISGHDILSTEAIKIAQDKILELAHMLNDNELAHFGVLGMKWGQRKSEGPASGVASKKTDDQAKATAKELGRLMQYSKKNTEAQRRIRQINKRVAKRSELDSEYEKAIAYHKPIQLKRQTTETKIAKGVVIGGASAYLVYKNADFLSRAMNSAVLAKQAANGAAAAAPFINKFGDKPISVMAQGLDGIWRLAA